MQEDEIKVRVSILLPLYNGLEFLPETLPSIFNQTFTEWSLWLGINGYSPEEEKIIVKKVAGLLQYFGQDANPRIHICTLSDQVQGAPATINYLTDLSGLTDQNNWVSNIDADDMWEPKKLEEQFKIIDQHVTDLDIIGTRCKYFGDSTCEPSIPSGWISKKQLFGNNPFIHSSVISKRGLVKYNPNEFTYDYDCWLKTYLVDNHTKFYNIPIILVKHRIHKQSFFNATGKQDPRMLVKKYVAFVEEEKKSQGLPGSPSDEANTSQSSDPQPIPPPPPPPPPTISNHRASRHQVRQQQTLAGRYGNGQHVVTERNPGCVIQ